MKRTMSSVIMSAYVISQRSWFSCSSCSSCFLRRAATSRRLLGLERGPLLGVEERVQLLLDHAGVGAGLDRQHALEDELHLVDLDLADPGQLLAERQPEDVGREDAPERRHEGAG